MTIMGLAALTSLTCSLLFLWWATGLQGSARFVWQAAVALVVFSAFGVACALVGELVGGS